MSHLTPRFRPAMHSAAAAIAIPVTRIHALPHMRLTQTHSSAVWSAWRQHSRPSSHSRTCARSWHAYAVATYTPKLPGWVRRRLPEMPEGKRLPSLTCEMTIFWFTYPGWIPFAYKELQHLNTSQSITCQVLGGFVDMPLGLLVVYNLISVIREQSFMMGVLSKTRPLGL